MTRLILIVMIVLLPLRSWAGDLMGVQMAMSASGGAPVVSAMPADCPMLTTADAEADANKMPAGMLGCCTSCELCIPFAELISTKFDVVTFAAHAKPLTGLVDFKSAAPAPAFKPPIS